MQVTARVRVLWLIKGLGPGGAERLLVAAAAARDRDRFEYRAAYLLPWKDHLVPELEALDVPVVCLGARDERDVRWAGRLRARLRAEPVDVVHSHSPYAAALGRLVVRTLPRRSRPRIVSTEHNAWNRFKAPTRIANALTSPLDDAVLAVSGEVRDSMRGPARRRTEIVIHGIDTNAARGLRSQRDAVRRELGIEPEEVLVGTIANYVPKKDYPNLLAAFRHVIDAGVPARLLAVGQGPDERAVHDLRAELGLTDAVILPGYRSDAVRLLAGCDVFTLASRWEGIPVALMEALALGLPVVTTAVGGIPEAVTDGVEANLVPARDPARLGAALTAMARDERRRAEMGAAAVARSAAFDIGRAVRRIEDTYHRVVGTRGMQSPAPR